MGEGGQIFIIVILAMVAAFIALRLRSVLGRRTDDPATPPPVREKSSSKSAAPQNDAPPDAGFGAEMFPGQAGESALKGLSGADRATLKHIFRPFGTGLAQFLEGAEKAYGQTLKCFWSGDMGEMEPFLGKEVAAQFKNAISERKARREVADNRLVEVCDLGIDDVHLTGPRAEITLRFTSEIIAVVKDRYGKLVEGDLTDTIKVTDIWTFARNLKSKDPNWTLVATQAG